MCCVRMSSAFESLCGCAVAVGYCACLRSESVQMQCSSAREACGVSITIVALV